MGDCLRKLHYALELRLIFPPISTFRRCTELYPPPFLPCSVIIIEKHYRGASARTICESFWEEARKYAKREVRNGPSYSCPVPCDFDRGFRGDVCRTSPQSFPPPNSICSTSSGTACTSSPMWPLRCDTSTANALWGRFSHVLCLCGRVVPAAVHSGVLAPYL
jgi:hypothetical protein